MGAFGKRVYTIAELSSETGLTQNTVRKYLKNGKLPGQKVGRGLWRVRVQDIKQRKQNRGIWVYQYSEEEVERKAREIADKMADKAKEQGKPDEEVEKIRTEQFEKFFYRFGIAHRRIDRPPLNRLEIRKLMGKPLDLRTLLLEEYDEADAVFFLEQYFNYLEQGCNWDDPDQRGYIEQIIDDRLRLKRMRRYMRAMQDTINVEWENVLDKVAKRLDSNIKCLSDLVNPDESPEESEETAGDNLTEMR